MFESARNKKVQTMAFIGAFCLLFGFETFGLPIDYGVEAVESVIYYSGETVCQSESPALIFAIVVSHHELSKLQTVEITQIDGARVFLKEQSEDIVERPNSVYIWPQYSSYLEPGQRSIVYGGILIPNVNGVYRDVVEIRWQPASESQQPVFTTSKQMLIDFAVKDGCMTIIDIKEFEQRISVFDTYEIEENGLVVEKTGRRGYTTYEPNQTGELPGTKSPEPGPPPGEMLHLHYCVKIEYRDNFSFVPTDTSGMLRQPIRGDGIRRVFRGLNVELWDRDPSGGDDFITATTLRNLDDTDYHCIGFGWDPDNPEGEPYPDVYIKTDLSVTNGTPFDLWPLPPQKTFHFCNEGYECDEYEVQWRHMTTYDLGSTGTSVYRNFDFGPATAELNAIAMQLSTLERFLEKFMSYEMTDDIDVDWALEQYPGGSRHRIKLSYQFTTTGGSEQHWYRRWDVGVHETGHAYHAQLLDIPYLWSMLCPRPEVHYPDTIASSRFVTKEGWAEFVALATWYWGGTANVFYPSFSWWLVEIEPGETPIYNPVDNDCGRTGVDNAWCNAHNEMQVARTFWDAYDAHADGYWDADDVSTNLFSLTKVWTVFPEGTANRHNGEEGCSGINLIDYVVNAINSPEIPIEVALHVYYGMLNNETWSQEP